MQNNAALDTMLDWHACDTVQPVADWSAKPCAQCRRTAPRYWKGFALFCRACHAQLEFAYVYSPETRITARAKRKGLVWHIISSWALIRPSYPALQHYHFSVRRDGPPEFQTRGGHHYTPHDAKQDAARHAQRLTTPHAYQPHPQGAST